MELLVASESGCSQELSACCQLPVGAGRSGLIRAKHGRVCQAPDSQERGCYGPELVPRPREAAHLLVERFGVHCALSHEDSHQALPPDGQTSQSPVGLHRALILWPVGNTSPKPVLALVGADLQLWPYQPPHHRSPLLRLALGGSWNRLQLFTQEAAGGRERGPRQPHILL